MLPKASTRRFRLSDMERILEIEQASFPEDAYDRNLFAEFSRKCGALFLVAGRGRNIWGYMVTCLGNKSAEHRAELVSVAVDPSARGRGVASSLIRSTLRRLRLRKVKRLTLTVRESNQAARKVYEHYGFEKVRRVPGYYHDGEDGVLMRLIL